MISSPVTLPHDVLKYLQSCHVTENDPAIIFDWNPESVDYFVTAANAGVANQSQWVSTLPGAMSSFSLEYDIVARLATVSGGRFGNTVLAPNNLSQLQCIIAVLRDIETDPFVQAIMKRGLTLQSTLAHVYTVADNRICTMTPSMLPPPSAPLRQVFA